MNRKLRSMAAAGIVGVSAVLLGSCSSFFEIEFSGFGPNIRLEFHNDNLLQSVPQATCLKELTVYELVGPSGHEQVSWQIKASAGCVTLTGIDTGHVPSGFVEETNRLPLKIGSRYQAFAIADKDYPDQGISSRWFVCRRSPEKADWKNESELSALPPSCLR
ncbi:hypothetical protein [Sphingomonas oligophenolica]|uniref:hypothetical protein n=1 Tax=Sphingomonas oligophenolica TaxID=301154 RepID=UPI00112DC1E2|nr:hypothetical protein [Sphingomonas oligophenolica]